MDIERLTYMANQMRATSRRAAMMRRSPRRRPSIIKSLDPRMKATMLDGDRVGPVADRDRGPRRGSKPTKAKAQAVRCRDL